MSNMSLMKTLIKIKSLSVESVGMQPLHCTLAKQGFLKVNQAILISASNFPKCFNVFSLITIIPIVMFRAHVIKDAFNILKYHILNFC